MKRKQKIAQITLRMPRAMFDEITRRAEKNFRAINGEICAVLEFGLKELREHQK